MRLQKKCFAMICWLIAVSTFSLLGQAQTPDEFQNRRATVIERMAPSSVMVLRSAGSFGTFHTAPQNGGFYYLTGINEPGAFLVLFSRHNASDPEILPNMKQYAGESILFVIPQNPERADWDAQPIGIEGAKTKMGFRTAYSASEFADFFDELLLDNPANLYMDIKKSSGLREPLTEDEQLVNTARSKGADFNIKSPGEILTEMSLTRSHAEIELLRTATDITIEAQRAAITSLKPGMYEYQLQAIVEYVYTLNGAQRSAFPCIIGSGVNSCILHWMVNTRKMESGDIVVIDIGAEYNLYGSDITRTVPVNGKFTKRQRDVYEIVLHANEAAIEMVAPGVDYQKVSDKADEIVGEGLVKLGLIKDKSEFQKYYFHGLSHTIGLRAGGRDEIGILKPGMVITIEPGIYIMEEAIGVRIEDDVLVTENGHDVLTKNITKQADEIEKLMQKDGLDYRKFLIKK